MWTHGSGPTGLDILGSVQVFAKCINGKTITIDVGMQTTVGEMKVMIQNKTSIPEHQQVLTHMGRPMMDSNTMEHYGITKESTIHISARLLGGMFTVPTLGGASAQADLEVMLKSWAETLNGMKAENEVLKEKLKSKDNKNQGLRKVVQSGNKELVPKRFSTPAISGSFKAWAR